MELLVKKSKEPLKEALLVEIGLAYRTAMLAFMEGQGTMTHWNTLAYCLNLGMALTELEVEKEGASAIDAGQTMLESARHLFDATGQWSIRKHNYIINFALEVLRRQLENASWSQVQAASAEVMRRNEQAKRSSH